MRLAVLFSNLLGYLLGLLPRDIMKHYSEMHQNLFVPLNVVGFETHYCLYLKIK